jgi:phosphoglycerate dehydrogenase-like enzyme
MKLAIVHQKTTAKPMDFRPEHVEMLRKVSPDVEVILCETEEELIEKCPDAEVLFIFGTQTPSKWAAGAKSLRWVQSLSAGVDKLEPLREQFPGLIISKIAGVHGIPMSESVIMYILMFLNCMPFLMRNQIKGVWEKPPLPGSNDCYGKVVGIVGMGDIGRQVAKKCKLFGMTVYGSKLDSEPEEDLDRIYGVDQNEEMVSLCDFVVSLVPAMPSTVGLFNDSMFAAMKEGSYLISMGRGVVVDEDALVRALESGHLAGAAMDVFAKEPLPADSPLWKMDNVILTPHCSANTPYYYDRAIGLLCDNLRDYLAGRPIRTEVK